MNRNKVINNSAQYYLLRAFNSFIFHVPFLTIYFLDELKSVTLVSVLYMVKTVTVFLFEVPTGIIADRYSRKLSIGIGIIFNVISLSFFLYNPSFITLVIAEIFFGLSECLISGADAAFYYDNLCYENKREYHSNFIKNIGLLQSVIFSSSFFIGSILYNSNKSSVFIFSIIFQILSFVVILTIKEHPFKKNTQKKLSAKYELKNISNTLGKNMFFLIINSSFIIALCISIYLIIFPLVTNTLTSTSLAYGIIYAIAMLAYGFGAKFGSSKISSLLKNLTFLVVILTAAIFFDNIYFTMFVVLSLRFVWGYISTNLNIIFNDKIKNSDLRATIFSIISIFANIFTAIVMLIIGLIIDYDISIRYIFILIIVILLLTMFNLHKIFYKGGEKSEIH